MVAYTVDVVQPTGRDEDDGAGQWGTDEGVTGHTVVVTGMISVVTWP